MLSFLRHKGFQNMIKGQASTPGLYSVIRRTIPDRAMPVSFVKALLFLTYSPAEPASV